MPVTNDPCDSNILLNNDFSSNNYSGWTTYSDAAGGFSDPCSTNVLTNGNFSSNNFTGWTFVSGGSPSTADASTGQAVITISGPTASTQLMQTGISVVSGTHYTLKFDAKTISGTNEFQVSMIQDGTPYSNVGSGYNTVNLTTTMQTFEYNFTATLTEANTRLRFYFAASLSGTIVIDNVCFSETTSIPSDTFSASSGVSIATLTGNATDAYLLQDGIPLENGKLYGLSFNIHGTVGQIVPVTIYLDGNPVSNLGFSESITLASTQQTYDYTFTANADTIEGIIKFNFSDVTGTVNIDNVCLGEILSNNIVPDFTYSPQNPLTNQTIFFTNTTTSDNPITTWEWVFGDGTTSNLQNPTKVYVTSGNYTVTLYADGVDVSKNITIIVEPIIISPLTNIANKYSMDSTGNVSLINTIVEWDDLFETYGNTHQVLFSYNIFSGLGCGIDLISNKVLYFNIDTGDYSLEEYNGAIIKSGQDNRLTYGNVHPILNGVTRGETYWNWYQNQQQIVYGVSQKPWPTILDKQVIKLGVL